MCRAPTSLNVYQHLFFAHSCWLQLLYAPSRYQVFKGSRKYRRRSFSLHLLVSFIRADDKRGGGVGCPRRITTVERISHSCSYSRPHTSMNPPVFNSGVIRSGLPQNRIESCSLRRDQNGRRKVKTRGRPILLDGIRRCSVQLTTTIRL